MGERVKVGVAGLTHGHVGGLIDSWRKVEGSQMVAVADATGLLDKIEGFERKYDDWRKMLDSEELDVLVVTSDSLESAQIAVEALGKGLPCLVEKPMAANLPDAKRMLEAWRASGKTLMINWPIAWSGWVDELKDRIEAGEIGTPFHFRFRTGHSGPKEIGCGPEFVAWLYDEKKNGGGAIGDFGCYGAVVGSYLLGVPESAFCVRGNYTKEYHVSDDHALIVLKYPKASASLEGTWATAAFDSGPSCVVHGTKGTLASWGDRVEISIGRDRETVNPKNVPGNGPAEYFLDCVKTGRTPKGILNPETAFEACRILDAALRSSSSGCTETLASP
jgi:predicted dehydrogenase